MTDRHPLEALLDESTRRRRLIEQLRGPSAARQLVAGSLSGLATAVIFAVVSNVMRDAPWWLALTMAFSVSAGLWAGVDVIALKRRLATLTAVLEESGVLDAYVDRAALVAASTESSTQE